jgi:hypothetical protein
LKKKALGVQDRWDHKGVGVTPRPAGRADPSRAERAPAWRARPQLGWAAISSRSVKRQPFLSPRICESRVVRGLVSRYTRPWRRRVQLGHGHGDGDGDGGGGRWFRSALPGRQGVKRRNQGRGTCAISAACSARAASCTQHIMPHQPKMMGPCRIEWRWVPKPPAFAGTPRPRRLNPTAQSAAPSIAHQLVQGLGVGDMGLLGAEQLPVPARPGFGGRRGIFPEMPFHVVVCVWVGGSAAPQQAFELAVGL